MNAAERLVMDGPSALTDEDLLAAAIPTLPGVYCRKPLVELAWAKVAELEEMGLTAAQAAKVAALFELGRRGAWSPPKRGERCLDPQRVYDLLRDAAHEERESFWVVMLDVRGRLMGRERVAQGSLSQCPVSPRDALRPAVKAGAHGVVFVHNHPSGDPAPSVDDVDLTDRLRAAAELVGVLARDHVVVAAGGYFSFVEAGRWRR